METEGSSATIWIANSVSSSRCIFSFSFFDDNVATVKDTNVVDGNWPISDDDSTSLV